MAEVHLIAVERENLFLRVALLNLNGEQRLLHLALPRLLVVQKELSRELLSERACAGGETPFHQVVQKRQHDALNAESDVLEELRILGGENRLPQLNWNVLIPDDGPPLGGKLADDPAVSPEDTRDRVGHVVVERGDLRQIVGVREEHAAQCAQQRRHDKEDREAGLTGDFEDVASHKNQEFPVSSYQFKVQSSVAMTN